MNEKLTIKDIAEYANTSKTTVSFYLNGKFDKMSENTKKRIEDVIKETNYQPSMIARCLNAKKMKMIGVMIGDITNTFANQIVKGIDDYLRDKQYQLIVGNSSYSFEKEQEYIKRMLSIGVDGFIIQPSVHFDKLVDLIKKEKKEVVFIDSQVSSKKEKWVKTNNYEVILQTFDKLIQSGYDNYIIITADPNILSTRKERVDGFYDALKIKNKVCETLTIDENIENEKLKEILHSKLNIKEKTLIFVANCFLLPKVYVALETFKSLIPKNIGLVGFDNTEWSSLSSPSITTIIQPAYKEGQQAAKILIDSIEGINEEITKQILPCDVNWCESTNIN